MQIHPHHHSNQRFLLQIGASLILSPDEPEQQVEHSDKVSIKFELSLSAWRQK